MYSRNTDNECMLFRSHGEAETYLRSLCWDLHVLLHANDIKDSSNKVKKSENVKNGFYTKKHISCLNPENLGLLHKHASVISYDHHRDTTVFPIDMRWTPECEKCLCQNSDTFFSITPITLRKPIREDERLFLRVTVKKTVVNGIRMYDAIWTSMDFDSYIPNAAATSSCPAYTKYKRYNIFHISNASDFNSRRLVNIDLGALRRLQ
jgi:hypothetical protein